MDQDIRRKTLQNFNERSGKAIEPQPATGSRANPMDESPGQAHDGSAKKSEDVSPYYKDRGQAQSYYEPSYFTQYGASFSKRTNRKSSHKVHRDQGSSLVSSMVGKFEM